MDLELKAESIDNAVERLEAVVRRTPLDTSERLTEIVGSPVLLKREDIQLCRSYKVRGAFNLMSGLDPEERSRGVVCASAGNHAQGVAFSAKKLGIKARVFLPTTTPRQKRDRIAAIGGSWVDLVYAGASFDEANSAARQDEVRSGAVYVHPFDDVRTVVGQGSIAPELIEQSEANGFGIPDTVVVPIGGGGLIAGISCWMKSRYPSVHIVGVEAAGSASMAAALANGGPVDLPEVDSFIDGTAVGRAGELTYPLVRDLVDEVVVVPEGAVCTEMLDLYQTEGIITEPAGALPGAALRQGFARPPQGPVVCVISGGNNDVSRYAEVVERSLLHEGLRHYFLVTFPQEPGALRRFLDEVLGKGEDIIVFEYVKKNNRETGPALVGIDLESPGDLRSLEERMIASGLQIEPVSPGSQLFWFLL